ncbi:MAG: hypothetical protein J6Y13_05270 [Treponema sp.]|nr:hypothetical protein [Treponema sp.]
MKRLVASLLALGTAGLLSAQVNFAIGARGTFGFGLGSTANPAENYASAYDDAEWECTLDYLRFYGWTYGLNHTGYKSVYDNENLNVKPFESFVAGGSIFGRIGFDSVPGLYIQPELGFYHNQVKYKYHWEGSGVSGSYSYGNYHHTYTYDVEAEGDGSFSYSSLDIPLLVGYDLELGHGFVISPYGGLNLSIPLGKLSWSMGAQENIVRAYDNGILEYGYPDRTKYNSSSIEASIKNGVIPGLILGTGAGYKFDDHNMIMGDLRYIMDFTAIRAETDIHDARKAEYKKSGYPFNWDEDDRKWYDKTFRWDAMTRRALTIGINYMFFF